MEDKHFTETIFYQIELTAKYIKMLGQQAFEKFNIDLSIEEFSVLDVLVCNEQLCQRDLAKLILKDRANTGKLLDTLEKKGLIERNLSIKNNRPVKFVKITPKGIEERKKITSKIHPHFEEVRQQINKSDLAKIGDLLKELREIMTNSLEIQI